MVSKAFPRISVITTSYSLRRLPEIRDLLESLRRQANDGIEVIFVIEGSAILAGGVRRACQELLKCKWLVHFERNIEGISIARNIGISIALRQQATGSYH